MNALVGFIALIVVAIVGGFHLHSFRERHRGRERIGGVAPRRWLQGNEHPRHHAQELYQWLQCRRLTEAS